MNCMEDGWIRACWLVGCWIDREMDRWIDRYKRGLKTAARGVLYVCMGVWRMK